MTDITPNHLHIYRDRRGKHITLDGQDLLLDGEDPMLITGMENPAEVTRVMLTLLAPKITVDSEIEDREPEPATVDAPEPTLAEELRDTARWWREGAPTWEQCCDRFESLAARAEQIEQERDDASAEVERITAEHVTDPSPTLNDPSMTRHATVAREENVSHDLPEPADVKPGESWIVNIDGVEIVPGFKASVGWICYRFFGGTTKAIGDDRITLVARLVPAPRQITTRGELNALPEGTVVRAKGELVCERYRHRSKGLVWISTGVDEDFPVDRPVLPATVLWTPEVEA